MKQKLVYILFCCSFLFACTQKKIESLADLIEIDAISSVEMSNNSGSFYLNDNQLASFKQDLKSLTYEPEMAAKVGAIRMELTIHGKRYDLSSATNGEYVEAHSSIATKNQDQIDPDSWLYFKTNGVNFDNYKKS